MQVFRFMNLPDRVLAFDELPEELVKDFELCKAESFPRYWKDWMGKKKRTIKPPPERDPLTNTIRKFEPIVEEDHFFYLVDGRLGPSVERWEKVAGYVRQNVKDGYILKEDISAMAVPLAGNKTDGVTLEPEDVPVIPLKKELILPPKPAELMKCKDCPKEFENKRALRMHVMKKHPAKEAAAA